MTCGASEVRGVALHEHKNDIFYPTVQFVGSEWLFREYP